MSSTAAGAGARRAGVLAQGTAGAARQAMNGPSPGAFISFFKISSSEQLPLPQTAICHGSQRLENVAR